MSPTAQAPDRGASRPGGSAGGGSAGGVKTLARGLDILQLFGTVGDELSQSDIAAATGLPMPTVHRLVGTLVEQRFLELREPGRRYRLGPEILRLGGAALGRSMSSEGVHEQLQQMSAEASETVNLATLVGGDVVYLDTVTGPRLLTPTAVIGSRIGAHCTALGKSLLAQLDDAEIVARLGAGPYPRLTPRTARDWPELRTRIEEVRRAGVAISDGEYELGLISIAAALPPRAGREPTAVNVSLPSARASASVRRKLERLIADGAAGLLA